MSNPVSFNLARNEATIHRRTCRHWRRAHDRGSKGATLWFWPDRFETLDEAFWNLPPWLNPCHDCDPFDLKVKA